MNSSPGGKLSDEGLDALDCTGSLPSGIPRGRSGVKGRVPVLGRVRFEICFFNRLGAREPRFWYECNEKKTYKQMGGELRYDHE